MIFCNNLCFPCLFAIYIFECSVNSAHFRKSAVDFCILRVSWWSLDMINKRQKFKIKSHRDKNGKEVIHVQQSDCRSKKTPSFIKNGNLYWKLHIVWRMHTVTFRMILSHCWICRPELTYLKMEFCIFVFWSGNEQSLS